MHMIHDIATYADQENGVLNVVIDIPAGSNNKYEYDHDLGCFTLDRVVHHSMFYPFNYGFLPQTLSKDGDPCDVCLYTTNPLFTGCVVKAYWYPLYLRWCWRWSKDHCSANQQSRP